MNELIEKLKKNNIAFGLLEPEEQECLENVGWENRLIYVQKKWKNDNDKIKGREREHLTYAIKPTYQPEPEYVDLEIEEHLGYLGVWRNSQQYFLPHRFTHLHCLPSLPNFVCFWYEWKAGVGYTPNHIFYETGRANYYRKKGAKVFARMRNKHG